ncbi:MAG: nitrous oxide reductase accessory protein NosL [Desulfobacteraceae bacterium]|jgi:mono/diheme cytochrome c family protein
MRKLITWCFVLISAFLFFSSVQAEEQGWCPLCSMNLKMFWKTSHWLTFSDGKTTGYCSIHCASKVYQKRPTEIDLWEVADYHMKTLINAHRAYFLIGSDLPGTMTPVSKLAFASHDVAKSYQKEHGGTLGTLDDALERAIEGRGEDMALIKKKKAKMSAMGKKLAGKHGCYKCHGEGGAGGRAVAWNTSEFASSMDSRVKIKKLILGGSHKMEGYQGKITEKELHAITIYVWTQRPK